MSVEIASYRAKLIERVNEEHERKISALSRKFVRELRAKLVFGPLSELKQATTLDIYNEALKTLESSMVLSHLAGAGMAVRQARSAEFARGDFKTFVGKQYKGIKTFLDDTLRLDEFDIRKLAETYQPQATKVIDDIKNTLSKNVLDVVNTSIAQGTQRSDVIKQATAAMEKAGVSLEKPWLLETVTRTQSHMAFTAGRLNTNKDPALNSVIWGYEYISMDDSRVRPSHAALHGLRLPKDHPRWLEVMPPNGWNCRCDFMEIFYTDRQSREINDVPEYTNVDGVSVRAGADQGWNFNPGELYVDRLVRK